MSRLSRKPVPVPPGVKVTIADDGTVTARGPEGELRMPFAKDIKVESGNGGLLVKRLCDSKRARCMEGTCVRNLENLVTGVSSGFKYVLDLVGVGYRAQAQAQGNAVQLQLGFSHQSRKLMPAGVTVATPSPTEIVLSGADKAAVGQMAAEIRALRPPEPYKGKGVRRRGERVRIREAKKK